MDRALVRGLLWAALAVGGTVTASLALGAGAVGPGRALAVLAGGGDADARFAVLELRVPRTLVAVAVGTALAVAGAVLQSVARNPLAEPGLLGVSDGASFAVVLVIALGASAAALGPFVAVLGAGAGCLLAVGAARLRGTGDDPIRLVLAGAALSSLLHAATATVLLLDQRTADEVRFWTV
ncbi:MAG TPA: iron ABC transporter permease, partial [Blastococcus sp.]